MSDRPLALVTGASSGIGMEIARLHAARGGDLIVVARRRDRLEALKRELWEKHSTTTHVLESDLSVPGAGSALHEAVTARSLEVDYLINNAGFGGVGLYHEQPWELHRSMMQVNVVALAEITHCFLPRMVERGSGRILNVASVAGFVPGPLQPVYYASKAFVVSFSQALDDELRSSSVHVTALCPGLTQTEFFDAAGLERAQALRFPRMSASRVARVGYDAMLKGRRIAIPGVLNWFIVNVALRYLPRRLTTRASWHTMHARV